MTDNRYRNDRYLTHEVRWLEVYGFQFLVSAKNGIPGFNLHATLAIIYDSVASDSLPTIMVEKVVQIFITVFRIQALPQIPNEQMLKYFGKSFILEMDNIH